MYQRLKRYYLIFCVSILPILLTACGKSAEEEKPGSKMMKLGFTGVIMLLSTVPSCIMSLVRVMKSQQSQNRGTNAVTKFVRHSKANMAQRQVMTYCGITLAFDLVLLFLGFSIPKLIITLLPIGTIVLAFLAMRDSTKSKDRVKASRATTKGALQVGAGAAKGAAVAGAAAATVATGGVAGAAIGAAVIAGGNIAQHTMDTAQKNMGKELDHDFDQELIAQNVETIAGAALKAKSQHIANIADTDLFRQKALRLGCNENMSLAEMAQMVLKYAPAASMAELPQDMPDEDKAVALLGAYKQQPKAIQDSSAPVIDAEYREVSSEKLTPPPGASGSAEARRRTAEHMMSIKG